MSRELVVLRRIPFNEKDEIYLELEVTYHARHYLVSFGIFSAVLPEWELAVQHAVLLSVTRVRRNIALSHLENCMLALSL